MPGKTTDMLFEDVKDFIPKLIIDALDTLDHQKSCVVLLEVPQVELPHSFGVKVSRKKGKREPKKGGGGSQNLWDDLKTCDFRKTMHILNSVLDLYCFFWGWGFWYFRKWHSLPRGIGRCVSLFSTKKKTKAWKQPPRRYFPSILSEFYPQTQLFTAA